MKKITIITIAIFALILSTQAQKQTRVRVNEESVGFWTISNDSIQFLKADRVIKGFIYVPDSSSASAVITGCTFTIDGHTTNGITLTAGEGPVPFGFDYAVSDTIKITTTGTVWVSALIER